MYNIIKKTTLLLLLFTGVFSNAYCQSGENENFKIYFLQSRYKESTVDYFRKNSHFDKYVYLGEYMIDPRKTGIYNERTIREVLRKLFPNSSSSGLLSLNIEGKIYKDLMNNAKYTQNFKKAEAEFIRIIKIIKDERPNVSVGIYGLPFRFYYASQKKFNADRKLDNLLSHLDYISPSLYSVYPDKEKGGMANEQYVIRNLEYSLEIGERLNKPVIPYVWHFVHPSNKRFGGNLVERSELRKYLKIIANHSLNGKHANGVIWWESSSKSFNSYMSKSNVASRKNIHYNYNQDDFIRYYTEDLFNNL